MSPETSVSPRHVVALDQREPAPRREVPRNVGFLYLAGYLCVGVAVALAATGGWHASRESIESTRWPAVTARLTDCRVHTTYDSRRGRPRASHSVACVFHYDANGAPHAVRSEVGNHISVVRGQIDLTRPAVTLASLQTWVKHHPDGALEVIHIDPADADRISLVGVDDDIRWQTTAGYLTGTLVFAALGAALLLVGVRLRATRRSGGGA